RGVHPGCVGVADLLCRVCRRSADEGRRRRGQRRAKPFQRSQHRGVPELTPARRNLEIARNAIERLSDYGHCVCQPGAVYACDYCVAEEALEALAWVERETDRIGNAL